MNHVLDELDKGRDVHAVDAALKRHEAISADIQAGVRNNQFNLIRIASRYESMEIKFNCMTWN
jgi:fructose-1,6-bisphosphatase